MALFIKAPDIKRILTKINIILNRKAIKMDDDTDKYIWALKEMNKALMVGLESALLVMDKWDDLPQEGRKEIIDNLRSLVEKNKEAYVTEPTQH
jgi:stalled ribosome rescue protein Dom34